MIHRLFSLSWWRVRRKPFILLQQQRFLIRFNNFSPLQTHLSSLFFALISPIDPYITLFPYILARKEPSLDARQCRIFPAIAEIYNFRFNFLYCAHIYPMRAASTRSIFILQNTLFLLSYTGAKKILRILHFSLLHSVNSPWSRVKEKRKMIKWNSCKAP